MNKKFYHGSYIKNLKELIPFSKLHNTIKKSVVYFTPNSTLALFYIWNRPYKWITFHENNNNQVVFTEEFEDQLIEFYNGISGSIYECDYYNTNIYETHIKGIFNSEVSVAVKNCTIIDNVYLEILKQERLGKVIVKRFNSLSSTEKEEISNRTIRAIHMLKLLDETNIDEQNQIIEFVRKNYPLEWEIASNNTKNEMTSMINEWRISVGLKPL